MTPIHTCYTRTNRRVLFTRCHYSSTRRATPIGIPDMGDILKFYFTKQRNFLVIENRLNMMIVYETQHYRQLLSHKIRGELEDIISSNDDRLIAWVGRMGAMGNCRNSRW